jgi:hypothetical protein
LDWKVGWLSALEDVVDISRRLSKQFDIVGSIGHEAARRDENAARINRGQAVAGRQRDDEVAMSRAVPLYSPRVMRGIAATPE